MPRAPLAMQLLVLAILLPTPPVCALEASPTCESDAECQGLLSQGMGLYDQGRFLDAHQKLLQAYSRRPDPTLLYSLGRTLHKAGRPREAIKYYQQFLEAGATGDAEQRRKAEQYLTQAQVETAPPSKTPSRLQNVPTTTTQGAEMPLIPSSTPHPSETPPTPLYRKPWLWAIVGVAVAGAAVGLGLGLAARRPDYGDATVARPFSN